jgi:hypothetical protein
VVVAGFDASPEKHPTAKLNATESCPREPAIRDFAQSLERRRGQETRAALNN